MMMIYTVCSETLDRSIEITQDMIRLTTEQKRRHARPTKNKGP